MKKANKMMASFILATILLAVNFSFAADYKAVVPDFTVLVDGERFYSEPPIVVIDGSTYLPLRALGDCLGVFWLTGMKKTALLLLIL